MEMSTTPTTLMLLMIRETTVMTTSRPATILAASSTVWDTLVTLYIWKLLSRLLPRPRPVWTILATRLTVLEECLGLETRVTTELTPPKCCGRGVLAQGRLAALAQQLMESVAHPLVWPKAAASPLAEAAAELLFRFRRWQWTSAYGRTTELLRLCFTTPVFPPRRTLTIPNTIPPTWTLPFSGLLLLKSLPVIARLTMYMCSVRLILLLEKGRFCVTLH